MHHEKRWRSKPPRAARISASMGSKKSSTNSSCSIVSERTSRHPSASLEATTAQGCLRSKTMGMPGKFSRIQPRSRFALMSLIRRRLAISLRLNRSAQRLLNLPVSMVLAGPRYSSRRSSGLRYCLRWKCRSIRTLPGWKGSKTKRYPLRWLIIPETHVVPLRPLPARKTELRWSPLPKSTWSPPNTREGDAPIKGTSPRRSPPLSPPLSRGSPPRVRPLRPRPLVREILAVRGPDLRLGGAPVLPAGKLRGYGSEKEEKQGRTRDVPVPLEDRGYEVDRERGDEPGQQEPALPPSPPGGPRGEADERDHEADERQEGEYAGLGALLEVQVVDLLDVPGLGPVLEPGELEGPGPRAGQGTFLPGFPAHPPVGFPETQVEGGEPLGGVLRPGRVAHEHLVGPADATVLVHNSERARADRQHRRDDHEPPERPTPEGHQLVAVHHEGVPGLQDESRREGDDQVVPESRPEYYPLPLGEAGLQETLQALDPPQKPCAGDGEDEQVDQRLQALLGEDEQEDQARYQRADAATGEREVERDKEGKRQGSVESPEEGIAHRGRPRQR